MALVECIPNFSEGRDSRVITSIRDAIAGAGGIVLDVSSDSSHNRSVITFVAQLGDAVEAAFAAMSTARELIDLTKHKGEHPRIGATDVVPFVPLEGTTMEDCIALARQLGARAGEELQIPVYLYERAATRPDRENLADVRRGEFEGLREDIEKNPARVPDFGPARIHPTAGATAVGARPFLVAYNVYLGPSSNLPVAKDVAKAIRGSSGGYRYIKGLGLEVDGQAQVSMNLVDIERTPLHRAFDAVKMEAQAAGVSPTWSEIVGLVPERALYEAAARHLQLRNFSPGLVLERKVREAVEGGVSLSSFVGSVASNSPTPGGGSVAAHAGALAAALAQMVAGLTVGKKKYAAVDARMKEVAIQAAELSHALSSLVDRDARAYDAVSAAYKLPKATPDEESARGRAIQAALLEAAEVPLETARRATDVAELAEEVARDGNTNAITDAGVAALLADAACRGASYNVRVNIASLEDKSAGSNLLDEARRLTARTGEIAKVVEQLVEQALRGESSV
jgi:glutamate formiminotransferase / formiminotetrahydrofolate cyclodeaminase